MIVVTRRLMYAWTRHYCLDPVKKFVATLNATYIVIVERISAACIVLMQSANRHPSDVKFRVRGDSQVTSEIVNQIIRFLSRR